MENNGSVLKTEHTIVDLSMIYEICGDDKELTAKMITVFVTSIAGTVEKLNLFFEQKDWQNLYKTAHSAKSSLSIVRIPELFDWILTIEQSAKAEKNLHLISDLIPKTTSTYLQVESLLKESFELKY